MLTWIADEFNSYANPTLLSSTDTLFSLATDESVGAMGKTKFLQGHHDLGSLSGLIS